MKDDYVLHLEQDNLALVADSSATRPGTKATLRGGYNELVVKSDGNVSNDKSLYVNDVEVVTKSTLRQLVSGILNDGGVGLNIANTPTLRLVGQGIYSSPLEAQATLPAASETAHGIVKVVHEGSHGFPCPGISDRTSAGVWNEAEKYMLIFRNGADDLEKDVFLSYYYPEKNSYVPTSERFRPPSLPITAKPLNIVHSGQGTIGINTTDGYFVLLTNNNTDWKSWRAVRLDFPTNHHKPPIGKTGGEMWRGWFTLVIGNLLYCVYAHLDDSACYCACWAGTITAANYVTMYHQAVHGTNANGTYQPGDNVCYVFDKIWGTAGEKCMAYNADGWWRYVDTGHHGDDIDWVLQGSKLRICHDGFNYASRTGDDMSTRHNISYVIDLHDMSFTFDHPGLHPMPFSRNGWSHPAHNALLGSWGGNAEFSPIRSNGKMMYLETDNLAMPPYMGWVRNTSGMSDFDNLVSGRNVYSRDYLIYAPGNYGGNVRMGFGGLHCIDDNIYLGKNADGSLCAVEVDPYGSYGPTVKGYGPTNNRQDVTWEWAFERKCMVSVYDGDHTKLQGVALYEERLTGNSQIGEKGPELPVTVPQATFNAFKQQVTNAYANGKGVLESRMVLMFHRVTGVPLFGTVQLLQPGDGGSKDIFAHLFTFTADRIVGTVNTLRLGQLVNSAHTAWNARGMSPASDCWLDNPTHSLYRLDDGAWAFTVGIQYQTVIGNSWSNQFYGVFNPKNGQFVFADCYPTYVYMRWGFLHSKEYGFGRGYQSEAGESYYFDRWGKTSAEVLATYRNNSLAQRLTFVMSRTDAGDNVTVSQLGATKVKDKITSLIPPARRVQGMDLSQDRVITRAMLANSDRIPNQNDMTYPVQQKHRDTLTGKALATHTHVASDFQLNDATRITYGAARLGVLDGADADALNVAEVSKLVTEVGKLWNRPKSVSNLDPSVQIDVEI